MPMVDVQVKGFVIYAENEQHERYDFFVPREHYRMNKTEAQEFIPEMHKLIDYKRDYKTYTVSLEELQKISN